MSDCESTAFPPGALVILLDTCPATGPADVSRPDAAPSDAPPSDAAPSDAPPQDAARRAVGDVGSRRTQPLIPRGSTRTALEIVLTIWAIVLFGIFCVTPDGTGFVQRIDSRASAALHIGSWARSNFIDAFGSPAVPFVLSIAVCIGLASRSDPWSRRLRPMIITLAAGAIAWVPSTIVRRPSPGHLGDLSSSNATSFPSVVAAMLVALAVVWARAGRPFRGRAALATAVVTIPIMLRLLNGSTWPLDEAIGALVGAMTVHLLRPAGARQERRRVRRRGPKALTRRLTIAAVLVGVTLPVGSSFASAMQASGNAGVDQRMVEWLRSNGLSPFVDRGESWWLWRHLPSPTATITELPLPPLTATGIAMLPGLLPSSVPPAILPALPREGTWNVAAADASGRPQIATTYFRPDPGHPSLVAAVAWISTATTKFSLIAGTKQPGGGLGPSGGQVPAASLGSLLAAFNSGYKMTDTPGGTLIEGRTTRTMIDGLATLAIRADGTATVGEWGRDITAAQGYVGLRQNLHLMVRNGVVVDGVTTNRGGNWGSVRNTLPTWRSSLGVTADGNLVYVAGNSLTLGVLAEALVRAGAVTGMELDIHRGMVAFNLFGHSPDATGHKLLVDAQGSANRYLQPDWRDFVMVTAR